jgi:hypothetical protein
MQTTITNQYEHPLKSAFLKVFHATHGKLHKNHFGPKIFTELQKQMLCWLYRRQNSSYRRFVKLLFEWRWPSWLGLKEIPGKSSIHRWMQQLPATLPRRWYRLLAPKRDRLLAIDATGVDSWRRSRHYDRRTDEKPLPYAKLDVIIDVKTHLVVDHVLRLRPRHETIGAKQMLKRNTFHDDKMLGDKGYDSEPLHELARDRGLVLFAPVRKSSRKRPKGFYRRHCTLGDVDYSQRNNVESFNHEFKSRHDALRSKLPHMKKKEVALQLFITNLEKTIQITITVLI